MQIISAVILVVLAVIGAASVIRAASKKLYSTKMTQEVYLVVPMKADAQSAEQTLRTVAQQLDEGFYKAARAVCLDCGMDEETKEICQKFSRGYPRILHMTPQEFLDEVK